MFKFATLLLIIFISQRAPGTSAQESAHILTMSAGTPQINLATAVDIFMDTSGKKDLTQLIKENPWQRNLSDNLSFSYTDSALWLRFTVKNTTTNPLYLESLAFARLVVIPRPTIANDFQLLCCY